MGSGNASAAQRRHPGWSRPSRVDLRSNEHQILRVLAATFKEPPPGSLARVPRPASARARRPQAPEARAAPVARWSFPRAAFPQNCRPARSLPSGRVPLGGRRHTMPCPVRPLALAENEQADGPKCGSRPRRDQGPVDRLPRRHIARRRHGRFALSIRKTRAIRPLHRARHGPGGVHRQAVLPVVTIPGHARARQLAEARLADRVCVRPANAFARQGFSQLGAERTHHKRPCPCQGKSIEGVGVGDRGHFVAVGRFRPGCAAPHPMRCVVAVAPGTPAKPPALPDTSKPPNQTC